MNKLVFSELRSQLLYQSIGSRKLNLFENLKKYSKAADQASSDKPNPKKGNKPVYITLIGTDGIPTTSILESAIKLSKRRNLKLIKVSDYDSIRQSPVYKLLSGAEVLKDDLEGRKNKKKSVTGFKGEKILSIADNISLHDLESKCKNILKWLEKNYEVKITISGSTTKTNGETIFKEIEQKIKEHGRILQKRGSGNDIKFQIIPPKGTKNVVE
ncbi:translation initiation factor IF-3, mitochondrial [Halyomorpha halys]|uniref:translation initiation factor IF-3, mitochondrial n=1 Tax=Halyomorpha halys TaxID=286706 RepID=UPI0006D4D907|nr:translation initiation factor IF-3, mitochondrial [Halyomorpha halys]